MSENQNIDQNNVRSINSASSAQLAEAQDQSIALVVADKIQPTTTEYSTPGAERKSKFVKAGLVAGAAVLTLLAGHEAMKTPEVPQPVTHGVEGPGGVYTTQPGDMYSTIAEKIAQNEPGKHSTYDVEQQIFKMNPQDELDMYSNVSPGEQINVPGSGHDLGQHEVPNK